MGLKEVLLKYWGYSDFREPQEKIVQTVLQQQDVLAVLPTGGGKSLCFQLPTMVQNSLCVVITPLIALMEDQVEQLRKLGIEAVAIHSGMKSGTVDMLLDNCIYGAIRFLYVSPERLQTDLFKARLSKMKLCLIAIDEAHCISQWGHDFRPAYLQIASIREIHPQVPMIALTASATKEVRDEIIEKLALKKPALFQKSFARSNLCWVVRQTEHKEAQLFDILEKVSGSAIVYVRSRRATLTISDMLTQKGIKAGRYHGGMRHQERTEQQEKWLRQHTRVMVATNAFGMGINKSNVRIVIHLDLPEDIESYYQEAGRAGRDGEKAYAVLIYHPLDPLTSEQRMEASQPEPEFLKMVYQALCNYYQLAMGSGLGASYPFDLHDFCTRFNFKVNLTFSALKTLETEGFIQWNDAFFRPSSICFTIDRQALYAFQIAHAGFDPLIKMMLRMYGAEILRRHIHIAESKIATAMAIKTKEVVDQLMKLSELQVIDYTASSDQALITWTMERQDVDRLPLNYSRMAGMRKLKFSKLKSMVHYTTQASQCRMQVIQEYFGEHTFTGCGHCDVCIQRKKNIDDSMLKDYRAQVILVLKDKPLSRDDVEKLIAPKEPTILEEALRQLLDEGVLYLDEQWLLHESKS